MNWTTLYITGKSDFREDVLRKLESSKLQFMPGYLERTEADKFHDLYWISDVHSLRDIKEAIGSKVIWKYRLRFFRELEDLLAESKRVEEEQDQDDEMFELPADFRRSA